MRIILFGLTGFGNDALKTLLTLKDVKVLEVYTTFYKNPFPYYKEEQLVDLCIREKLICCGTRVNDPDSIKHIKLLKPDLILVATFKQIICKEILDIPKNIVNIHPSLLPKYRGAFPIRDALKNKEQATGVTFHRMTEKVDCGDTLLQKNKTIQEDDTEGTLRKKLSILASEMIPELLDDLDEGAWTHSKKQ